MHSFNLIKQKYIGIVFLFQEIQKVEHKNNIIRRQGHIDVQK